MELQVSLKYFGENLHATKDEILRSYDVLFAESR